MLTALFDHLAVIVRMTLNVTITRSSRGLLIMNVARMKEVKFREKLLNSWVR
jgi:hypothetical protein